MSTTSSASTTGSGSTSSSTTGSSRSEVVNYVVFKSKGHQNTVFTPMDIHPVNPWILFADSDNNIVIQNYITSQKILNFSIGQHEEERRELHLLQRKIPTLSTLALTSPPTPPSSGQNTLSASPSSPTPMSNMLMSPSLNQAHRSPNNTVRISGNSANLVGGPSSGGINSAAGNDHIIGSSGGGIANRSTTIGDSSDLLINEKLEKLGQIRFLHFYDRHTRLVKDRRGKSSQAKSGAAASGNKVNNSIGADDYIVVVADNRILFINYHSQRIREVKVPIFDFKPPTSIEFFSNLPLVAFGCNDSVIRLWNIEKWELEKPLTGGHTKNNTTILKMKSIESETGDYLVSAGSDGYTCIWNIKTSSLLNQFPKVHDIIDLTVDPITNHIMVLTSDKVVLIYDITTMKEISKVSCGKREFNSLDSISHPRFPHDILLTMKSPAHIVLLNHNSSQSVKDYSIDIDQLLNPAKKEKAKLYKLIQHPLQPQLWLVWVNKTIYLLSTMASSIPTYATSNGLVYFPQNGYLNSMPLTNALSSEKTVIKEVAIPQSESVSIDVSANGTYLSVHYLSTSQYQVYEISNWKLLEKGSAIDVAWSGKGKDGIERFGKLERIFDVVDPVKKKKLTLGVLTTKKKKEEETSSKILLKTKDFSNPQISQELLLHTNDDRITSGLLMGVYSHQDNSAVTNQSNTPVLQETPTQITGEENESKSFQLYDWWTLQPIGEPLPPPLKIFWDPNQNYCIFVYSQYFCLFKIRPTIHMLCRWPFTLTSALWHNNTLFFTTPNEIQCLFPNNHESAPLILASSSGVVFPEDLYEVGAGSLSSYKPNQTFSLFPQYKPTGSVGLVEVNNEGLVIVDSNNRFHCLPLTHYLFKFFALVQMDLVEQAVKCAPMIDPKYHYLMAKFLTVRGHAKYCLQLTGISHHMKFLICINNHAYDSSLDIIPRLAEAIKSNNTAEFASTDPEEHTISYLGKKCIEIGHLCQNKNEQELAERAFRIATTLDPHSAYQELALHYIHYKKMAELKELQQSIQQLYPLECGLISLLIE